MSESSEGDAHWLGGKSVPSDSWIAAIHVSQNDGDSTPLIRAKPCSA